MQFAEPLAESCYTLPMSALLLWYFGLNSDGLLDADGYRALQRRAQVSLNTDHIEMPSRVIKSSLLIKASDGRDEQRPDHRVLHAYVRACVDVC